MKINIYPYQWELLAAMLSFKATEGLCIDYNRLGKKDYEVINNDAPTISILSLKKWFTGRAPANSALNDLCRYISNIFKYKTWDEFLANESNIEMLNLCQNWDIYSSLLKAEHGTLKSKTLMTMKKWAFRRVAELIGNQSFLIQSNSQRIDDGRLDNYIGKYNYFMPGQIPPEKYTDVYVNPLEIGNEGKVFLQNAFNKKEFRGFATIHDSTTLQILLSPVSKSNQNELEYVIFVRIDKYEHTAIYFPALVLGYDGQGKICSYPILLTSDMALTKESPLVRIYLDHCYKQYSKESKSGRMSCISPQILQKIFFKSINKLN